MSLPTRPDSTTSTLFKAVDDSLASFFKRPITIATYTWTPLQGAPFTAILDPWSLYFGNPRVINRINNYTQMRSKLCVKFLVNGNSFYYGRLMADYAPLSGFDQVQSYSTLVAQNAVAASQRMKVFIDPSDCCSNQMCLPFVWMYDSINIPNAEWSNLGDIFIRELNPLKHANGSVQPITITVMAWAEDIEMAIPTSYDSSALVAQAGEEYAKPGPVENVASAVASVASKLDSVPIIGPYARATAMAAGAASKLAGVLGLSRPPIILPLDGMRPTFISHLAPGDAGDNSQKVTVDSKQELTIDPNVMGLSLPDELNIASMAARESYLTTFAWTTAKTSGDFLFNSYVDPSVCVGSLGTFYLPACTFATVPFDFWRGRMRFRFQIVASGHHKGRLRFVYDPMVVQSVESNVQYTRFVDISTERDIVMEVDWSQADHYRPVLGFQTGATYHRSTTPFVGVSNTSNGVLAVYVVNDLATPNSTVNNDISINVFVSCEDLEVASPSNLPIGITNGYTATVQAGEEAVTSGSSEPGCGPSAPMTTFGAATKDTHDFEVYFGERVVNFRELLHRYVLHSSLTVANSSAGAPSFWQINLPKTPVQFGYNTQTLHTTTAAKKFNYVRQTMLAYLMTAFVGMRGSQRSKYVVSPRGAVSSLAAHRNGTAFSVPATATVMSQASQSTYGRAFYANRTSFADGTAITPTEVQPVLEVEYPFQKPLRFDQARIAQRDLAAPGNPWLDMQALDVVLTPGVNPVTVDRYVSIGEDFTLFWFQGAPPITFTLPPA